MKKSLFVVFVLIISSALKAAPVPYGQTSDQQETLQWVFSKAQKFSGITSLYKEDGWKKLSYFIVSEDELGRIVCPQDPQNCHGLAAVYDTVKKQIFIREDVNPDDSMINISFLLHEMVHALQNETRSEDEMFGTCQRLFNTEKEAYTSQDAFLKSEGQFFRASSALRFFMCNDDH